MTKTVEHHYPSFRRWVGEQRGVYQVKDLDNCPLTLWGRTKGDARNPGMATVRVDGKQLWVFPFSTTDGPADFRATIDAQPMTYEALAERLDKRFTKTGLRRDPKRKPVARKQPYPTILTGSFKRGSVS